MENVAQIFEDIGRHSEKCLIESQRSIYKIGKFRWNTENNTKIPCYYGRGLWTGEDEKGSTWSSGRSLNMQKKAKTKKFR